MNIDFLRVGLKYGVGSIIALYLVYFLANSVSQKLDTLITSEQNQAEIERNMLIVLKDIHDVQTGANPVSFAQPSQSN